MNSVQVFHVNVGIGDSSIYLLVDGAPATGYGGRIQRAVLIDGGLTNYAKYVIETKEWIEDPANGYTFVAPATTLQFDAIVVTHWDQDHWMGVRQILHDYILSQIENPVRPPGIGPSVPPPPTTILKYTWFPATTIDPVTGKAILKGWRTDSTFYAPYIKKKRSNTWPHHELVDADTSFDGSTTLNFRIRIKVPATGTKKARTDLKSFPVANMVLGDKALGVELFTGKQALADSAAITACSNPTSLLQSHGGPTEPGLYVVASDNRVLGQASPARGRFFIADSPVNGNNVPSIITMAIAPGTPPRIMNYSPGDAQYDTEALVVGWAQNGQPPNSVRVPLVKSSHHGSVFSTPRSVIETFQPTTIIVSAGNSHNHPSWESLIYWDAYYTSLDRARAAESQRRGGPDVAAAQPVLPTNYPSFLNVVNPAYSVVALAKSGIYAPLDTACTRFGSDFYTNTRVPASTLPKAVKVAYIQAELNTTRWKRISGVSAVASTPDTVGHIIYRQTPVTTGQRVLFYFVALPNASGGQLRIETHESAPNPTIRVTKRKVWPVPKINEIVETRVGRRSGRTTKNFVSYDSHWSSRKRKGKKFMEEDVTDSTSNTLTGSRKKTASTPSQPLDVKDEDVPFIASTLYEDSTLSTAEAFDDFLAGTVAGFVALETALTPSSSTVHIVADDPIMSWLDNCGLGVSKFSLTGTQTATQTIISAMSIDLSIPSLLVPFTFSSSAIPEVFGPLGSSVDTNGIFKGSGIALMALMPQTSITTYTLPQLFSVPSFEMYKPILLGLTDDIQFKIDSRSGSRCGFWYSPQEGNRVSVRLQFVPKDATFASQINAGLQKLLPRITIQDVYFVSKFFADYAPDVDSPLRAVESEGTVCWSVTTGSNHTAQVFCVIDEKSSTIIIRCDQQVSLDDIISWIEEMVKKHIGSLPPFDQWIKPLTQKIFFRQLSLGFSHDTVPKLLSLVIDLEVVINFSSKGETLLLMQYHWPPSQFTGTLWTAYGPDPEFPDFPNNNFFAEHEPYKVLLPQPENQSKARYDFGVTDLDPKGKSVPGPPPSGVNADLLVNCSMSVDAHSITFFAELDCDVELTESSVPSIIFNSAILQAAHSFQDGQTSFSIAVSLTLSPRETKIPSPPPPPDTEAGDLWADQYDHEPPNSAEIDASISYLNETWTLDASVVGLNLGLLYSLFDRGHADIIYNFLESITVNALSLTYEYTKSDGSSKSNSAGKSLSVEGSISLGDLELHLDYHHNGGNDWDFKATIGTAGTSTTLGSMISSVCPRDISGHLPACIGNISVPADEGILIEIVKICPQGSQVPSQLVCILSVPLPGGFHASLIQFQKTKTGGGDGNAGGAKRLLRISSGVLATSITFPVIGTLSSPVDEIDFIWVSDSSSDGGIMSDELDELNALDVIGSSPLGPLKKPATAKTTLAFSTGSHFFLMDKGTAVFDYNFGQSKSSSTTQENVPRTSPATERSSLKDDAPLAEDSEDPSTTSDGPSTKVPFKKTIGPLTISNIGIHLKNNVIMLLLDAAVRMGPFEFELLGCGLGFNLEKADFTHFNTAAIELELAGLALAWNDPPVEVSALFEVVGPDEYVGGVTMTIVPYAFAAFGSYDGSVSIPGHSPFKSIFMFAELYGPLIELEFAELQGIKLGFGYNSQLSLPGLTDLPYFPFVTGIEGTDPIAVLTSLCQPNARGTTWVSPTDGPLWLAAGLDITAFDIANINAIVIFEFNPLILSILAFATAQMPKPNASISPSTTAPAAAFIYVEFGIIATLDYQKGTLTILGSLTPNSFVMNPSCHLGGGFGLCYWFSGSGHDGDWVFTIGGYHPQFTAPKHYPNPERLCISWQLDSCLSVTGQAYFAVTPHCCMGGGLLMAYFSCGPLSAHFNAWADFLMNFSPFHYQGSVGVSVGVEFDLDLFICTIHISVDIDASLDLHGPPFGGVAHVDFWVFGFDIHFGDDESDQPDFNLERFANLLLQQSASAGEEIPTVQTSQKTHVFALQAGAFPNKKDKKTDPDKSDDGKPWNVRGDGMVFRIHSRMAISNAGISGATSSPDHPGGPIGSRPMRLQTTNESGGPTRTIDSQLSISCVRHDDPAKSPMKGFTLSPVMKDVPSAIWGSYSTKTDPTHPDADSDSIINPTTAQTTSLMLGVEVTAPPPNKAVDALKRFNVHDAFNHDCFEDHDDKIPKIPVPESQTAFLPVATVSPRQPFDPPPSKDERAFEIATAWRAKPKLDPTSIVKSWAQKLRWQAAAAAAGITTTPLVGQAPARVLAAFDDVYKDVPLLASVQA